MKFRLLTMMLCAGFLFGCGDFSDISDEEAIQRFEAHEEKFVKIAEMMESDLAQCVAHKADEKNCHIQIIVRERPFTNGRLAASYKVDRRTGPKNQITLDRLEEYMSLADQIGLEETFLEIYETLGGVTIVYYSSGFVTGGTHRSYKYKPTVPTPLLDSLKRPIPRTDPSHHARHGYRKIRDDWYLYVFSS